VTVLIDPPSWPAHDRLWSHLASDTSYDELHAFAGRLGVPRRAFEGDHYDVPQERYEALVAAGALPVASRELLRALQRSGLRRPKRKGERVLASRVVDGTARWDLLASSLAAPRPASTVVLVMRPARTFEVLVVPHEATLDLPTPAAATGTGVDLSDARPCGHERTAPLGPNGPDLARATWRTVLTPDPARADVEMRLPAGADGPRWVAAADVRARRPRWWPLVAYVTSRR
jgi:hypothetical protein